uniref:Uncharacterized protein n=1 Tax=Rhipicephalus microplus TaxID=6941 RepID=A0A6G5AEX8_RHIMP
MGFQLLSLNASMVTCLLKHCLKRLNLVSVHFLCAHQAKFVKVKCVHKTSTMFRIVYIAVSASKTLFSHYPFTPFISCSSMLESVQFLADIQQLRLTIAFLDWSIKKTC